MRVFRPLPSFPAKLRVGIFWLWFQQLDAAGMLSCTPKNKSACASIEERRGLFLYGSDRSAGSGLISAHETKSGDYCWFGVGGNTAMNLITAIRNQGCCHCHIRLWRWLVNG